MDRLPRPGDWFEILMWMFGFACFLGSLGLVFLLVRYSIHPQQYRDVNYSITRTVYVWAKPAAKTP